VLGRGTVRHIISILCNLVFCTIAGKVVRSPSGVMHGKSSLVYYDEEVEDNLFAGLSKYTLYSVYP
jgi:hypothetical protein